MEEIKNKEIIEFFKSGQSLKDVADFLLQKAKGVEGASLKFNSYYKSAQRLNDTYKKLKKNKSFKGNQVLDEFLDENIEFPVESFSKTIRTSAVSVLEPSTSTAAHVLSDIADELSHEKSKVAALTKELNTKQDQVKVFSKDSCRRNRSKKRTKKNKSKGKIPPWKSGKIHQQEEDQTKTELEDKI